MNRIVAKNPVASCLYEQRTNKSRWLQFILPINWLVVDTKRSRVLDSLFLLYIFMGRTRLVNNVNKKSYFLLLFGISQNNLHKFEL